MAVDPTTGLVKLVDRAVGNVAAVGRALGTVLRLPGSNRPVTSAYHQPGAPPGIEHLPDIEIRPEPGEVRVRVLQFSPSRVEAVSVPIDELESWLATPTPDWVSVRWINVDGLHPWAVERLRKALGFHTLAAEDALHVPQRPGVEAYDEHLFVKTRLLMLQAAADQAAAAARSQASPKVTTTPDMPEGLLVSEQVSMFVWQDLLLTIQERAGDVWEPLRSRIWRDGSRVRQANAGFLMYALLDAAIDHCFPLLEHYGDTLEDLEDQVLEDPEPETLLRVQRIRRELNAIRRVMWPTRELIDGLFRDESGLISSDTHTYLRDVHAHTIQLLDIIEAQREMCTSLTDLYMSGVSTRMNETMRVLTVMASLFIPITFLAGVYGMNFEHIPELKWAWGYPAFWGICVAVTIGLLLLFRRKGWS
ncbi:Magnesium and cobalt transport protein CorA [Enhygromyxa salina]|uniref:Magnesium transport protein CorA n=1 Tax=Enhygromyxa salina TaxID=215803 RepID=A0A0C1Z644_9BACT|nr:magnesium/cobalt transporter CorA [Enhygromyxa salina]KIG13109.1 Magnesium and cobalt transport protein CorA [Enhygromyxa salina]